MSRIKYLLLSAFAAIGIAAWIVLVSFIKTLYDIYGFFHA